MRNFMDLSRALKGLADAFHTIKLKLDGLYDSAGAIGNQFELIEEITLTEDTAVIERTTEPDTTPYNFKKLFVTIDTLNLTVSAITFYPIVNGYSMGAITPAVNTSSTHQIKWFKAENIDGMLIPEYVSPAAFNTFNSAALYTTVSEYFPKLNDNVTSMKVNCTQGELPTGTIIKIYAVRA